jgi:hypothetical protein
MANVVCRNDSAISAGASAIPPRRTSCSPKPISAIFLLRYNRCDPSSESIGWNRSIQNVMKTPIIDFSLRKPTQWLRKSVPCLRIPARSLRNPAWILGLSRWRGLRNPAWCPSVGFTQWNRAARYSLEGPHRPYCAWPHAGLHNAARATAGIEGRSRAGQRCDFSYNHSMARRRVMRDSVTDRGTTQAPTSERMQIWKANGPRWCHMD